MILPIVNIVAGFVLAAPKLKEWFAKENIEKAENALSKWRVAIGVIVLILGIVGLLKRMSLGGLMYEWSWHYGSSYPQAIVAILMGLLLCVNYFSGWARLHARIIAMNKYAEWIGLVGILVGLLSLF